METVKILALCIVAALLAVLLKQYKSEYAFISVLASGCVILVLILGDAKSLFNEVYSLSKNTTAGNYFKTALKALGIAYITSFAANSCRDFGQSALAAKAELAGKTALCILSLPLLSAVLKLALSFANI